MAIVARVLNSEYSLAIISKRVVKRIPYRTS